MEPLYLLIGAGVFALARKKAAAVADAAPPAGASNPPPPPTGDRAELIASLWDNSIPGLDFVRFALYIGQRESGTNYRPLNRGAAKKGWPLGMNSMGFVGMYQCGAPALEGLGFIKAGTWRRPGSGGNHQILTTVENWTDKCPGGLEQYLNSPTLQEQAMVGLTKLNYRALKRNGALTDASSPSEKAGYLSAAHLVGAGGARKLKDNIVVKEGYGTGSDTAYRKGAATQVA